MNCICVQLDVDREHKLMKSQMLHIIHVYFKAKMPFGRDWLQN